MQISEKIQLKKTTDLTPYLQNSRVHTTEQIQQICDSIVEFGFTNPILIDDKNEIVAGHARVEAAKKLTLEKVPTISVAHLTQEQKRAYVIADNQLALNADWDFVTLQNEVLELAAEEFDLALLGFTDAEIAGLLDTTDGKTDPDAIPENVEPVSQLGDVWTLGRHRLVCGDCTNADVVDKCLNGVEPHLMVTDPPYGVEYDAGWRSEAAKRPGKGKNTFGSAARAEGKVENDDRVDWSEAWALFPGDVAYVWHAGNMAHIVAESLIGCGLEIRAQVIWAKNNIVIGRGHYHPKHEPCWYAVRKKQGATGHWQGDRKQSTVWNIDKPMKSETGHSTQKPVECMKRPIENNSSPGQAVYEPFSGSGTTIIAAEMTGRACHAIEISPIYVDIAVKRWEEFTGKTAKRIINE